MKKNILFYTQIFYLDAALEYILRCSKDYKLDVFIELAPESKKANILNLNVKLADYSLITPYKKIAQEWNIEYLAKYFTYCNSVNFVIHPFKRSISFSSISRSLKLSYQLTRSKYDFLHFDEISMRIIGLLPFIFFFKKKIIFNIHDPKAHLGEADFKKTIIKKYIFSTVKKFICFSKYSFSELRIQLPERKKIFLLRLLPFTVYQNFQSPHQSKPTQQNNKITFIGRISAYKGIELFIGAINLISQKFTNQEFIIAGNAVPGYVFNPNDYKELNIEFRLKHLANDELVNIIESSKLIVCPYIEATQSGVIPTAYALGRPVLVTPVGGLPEYVEPNVTGFVADECSSESVANSMAYFLNRFNNMTVNQDQEFLTNMEIFNQRQLKDIYI